MSANVDDIWMRVAKRLKDWSGQKLFCYGQNESVEWMAARLPKNGLLIADEVGLGKTRLALLSMYATMLEGGAVAAVVPPGLLYQWEQEADDVWDSLAGVGAVEPLVKKAECIRVRSYSDLFMNAKASPSYPICLSNGSRWLLISQAFDLYIIKKNAASWRLELPALVNACISEKKREDRKNRWYQYWRQRGYEEKLEEDPWKANHRTAARFLSKHGRSDYSLELQQLFDDDRLRPTMPSYAKSSEDGRARQECVELFQNGRDGRKLLMEMVGKLIGQVDLLVMDEAHKSRESGDEPVTRFGRLVGEILITSPRARRIGMTATPVELHAKQWPLLLKRIHGSSEYPGFKQVQKAVDEFSSIHEKVMRNPDQLKDLDELALAARAFTQVLAPVVTRRRRLLQPEWDELLPQAIKTASGAHPHRTYGLCPIEINNLDEQWRMMVLALESQGIAAKGIRAYGLAQRQTDIRYAQGLPCEFDDVGEDGLMSGDRKSLRVKYWQSLQKNFSDRISGRSGNWLWHHPRILHSADRIEKLCSLVNGMPSDKVLVFGRFTDPLHALRDVVNTRHLLRIIDLDIIAFPPLVRCDSAKLLRAVWSERHACGAYVGKLAGKDLTQSDLLALARKVHRRYEIERDRLANVFNAERKELWCQLPGDSAIEKLGKWSESKLRDLFTILRGEVFDEMLSEGRDVKSTSINELRERLAQVWKVHCRCMLYGQDDILTDDGQLKEENEKLDEQADQLSLEILKDYFGLGKPGESDARSQFCRVLDGSVGPRTRRSIQSGFNDKTRGPFVLVAQSLVGREGLNLHKACRKVFLLHPEWNPGIMEQQIGRVDRIESLWTSLAKKWLHKYGSEAPPDNYPRIEVESVVFKGTYDQYQFQILKDRRNSLNAQLFGELLDEETLASIPNDYREKLADSAPDWSPSQWKKSNKAG